MPNIKPAIAEGQNRNYEPEHIQQVSGLSSPQQARHERQNVRAHSSVNQQALSCIFNVHLLFVIPAQACHPCEGRGRNPEYLAPQFIGGFISQFF